MLFIFIWFWLNNNAFNCWLYAYLTDDNWFWRVSRKFALIATASKTSLAISRFMFSCSSYRNWRNALHSLARRPAEPNRDSSLVVFLCCINNDSIEFISLRCASAVASNLSFSRRYASSKRRSLSSNSTRCSSNSFNLDSNSSLVSFSIIILFLYWLVDSFNSILISSKTGTISWRTSVFKIPVRFLGFKSTSIAKCLPFAFLAVDGINFNSSAILLYVFDECSNAWNLSLSNISDSHTLRCNDWRNSDACCCSKSSLSFSANKFFTSSGLNSWLETLSLKFLQSSSNIAIAVFSFSNSTLRASVLA